MHKVVGKKKQLVIRSSWQGCEGSFVFFPEMASSSFGTGAVFPSGLEIEPDDDLFQAPQLPGFPFS